MKLRTHILLWLLLTSLLPLLALMLGAIFYSQRVYLSSIDQELRSALDRVALAVDRHFSHQRLLLDSLAQSPVMLDFARAVREADSTQASKRRFEQGKQRVESLLSDLQPLIAEDAVIRLLDAAGNTLVKIRFGISPQPQLESLPPYVITEIEPDSTLVRGLRGLSTRQVSHLRFPHASQDYAPLPLRLLDMARPVTLSDQPVLYLVLTSVGERLDRLLDTATRPFKVMLFIVERDFDPGQTVTLLYDDARAQRFAGPSRGEDDALMWLKARLQTQRPDTVFEDPEGEKRYYVSEYSPYPDRLLTWQIGAQVDRKILTEQFTLLRIGLVALGLVALASSVFLAGLAARQLSAPITRLAENLTAVGHGAEPAPDLPSTSTEIKALQASFRDMMGSLNDAEAARAAAQQRLVQTAKLASVGEMAAGIGHELNNPLHNIMALARLLRRQLSDDASAQADLASLREEAERASVIVRGILNFARQIQPANQRFKVKPWLEACVRRVQRQAGERNIELRIAAPTTLELWADPFQLEQVVVNLLSNAIHASGAHSRVEISATDTLTEVRLSVRDHGTGLPAAAREHLFEPFFTTKPVGEGSGLGLSVSLGIIQSHAGELRLENHPDGGTIAEISLPLQPPDELR
ncbi:MAG: sensor histidine kinase [Thiotrichales bacterium]